MFAAMFDAFLSPGTFNEDAAHGLRVRSEEMPAAVPLVGDVASDEAEVGLVHQGRRLDRLAGLLRRHPGGGQLGEFVVGERQEVRYRFRIAGRGGLQELSNIGHGTRFYLIPARNELIANPFIGPMSLSRASCRHRAARSVRSFTVGPKSRPPAKIRGQSTFSGKSLQAILTGHFPNAPLLS